MALVTAAQVRAVGLPEVTGTATDADLLVFAGRADSALARWCDYPIPTSATVHTLESASYVLRTQRESEDVRTLSLPWSSNRITAITSIYDDEDRDFAADSLVASSDYGLLSADGEVLLTSASTQGAWSAGKGYILATVVVGWTSSTAPGEVAHSICALASHWWRLRHEMGHLSVSAGGGSVSVRDETIPDAIKELMQPWRLVRWPS